MEESLISNDERKTKPTDDVSSAHCYETALPWLYYMLRVNLPPSISVQKNDVLNRVGVTSNSSVKHKSFLSTRTNVWRLV